MGFLDILGKAANFIDDMAQRGREQQRQQLRNIENRVKASNHGSGTTEERKRKNREMLDKISAKKEQLEKYDGSRFVSNIVENITSGVTSTNTSLDEKIMGKSINEWDSEWICIGKLKNANLSTYNHVVGLYRHVINSSTMYVGRAIELNNGGLRKRLSDYTRNSGSARTHKSGQTINQHLDEIVTYILVVGDTQEAVVATKKLERCFISKYNPIWNVR